MWKFLKEYLSFTPGELRIIVIISLLIFFSLFARLYIPGVNRDSFALDPEYEAEVDSFVESLENISYDENTDTQTVTISDTENLLFPRIFDPNSITSTELKEMGFPAFAASNLLKFREAGGRFSQTSDLRKIYGVTDPVFSFWEEYVVIEVSMGPDNSGKESVPELTELNSADSLALIKIKGIGPYFAGKIIRYRDKLGGFVSPAQLGEIRGMDSVKLVSVILSVYADTSLVKKIDLNRASKEQLEDHPYITGRLASSLIKYRSFAGAISDPQELIGNRIMDEKTFLRLKPYLQSVKTEKTP
jgi:competence protein ComEA